VKALRKERDQITEHVARAGKAMQQKKRRSIGRTGFSIEYLEAVDFSGAVIDGGHVRLLEEVYACGRSGRGYPFRWSPTLMIEIAVDN
jgi:hypothetical protein